jgi:uncharacterized protein (TIGR00159 family)
MLGSRYRANKKFSLENLFSSQFKLASEASLLAIVEACRQMSENYVGALIVLSRESELREYVETGEILDAEISVALIKSIFFKNSPLHDGAVIINLNRIKAARCILPITQKLEISPVLGLRHRAAIGLSEQTDAYVIVVSEENGHISLSRGGEINENISSEELFKVLETSRK